MLVHVVLFRWKPHVTPDRISRVLEGIQKLKEVCDGIADIYAGENISKRGKGFTHAIIVLAESQEALNAYKAHPLHKTIASEVDAMEDEGIGVDFES